MSTFEDRGPLGCKTAVPVDENFPKNPTIYGKGIYVVNYTGCRFRLAVDLATPLNAGLPDYRENQREIANRLLIRGSATLVAVPPHNYFISISQFVQGQIQGRVKETDHGFPLSEIEDEIITVEPTIRRGISISRTQQAELDDFAILTNTTSWCVQVTITKSNRMGNNTPEQQTMESIDNSYDRGREVVAREVMKPGTTWHFKRMEEFFVRAIETFDQAHPNNNQFFAPGHSSSSMNDYIEERSIKTTAGRVVVFFKDEKTNGGIRVKDYAWKDVKPVNQNLVITIMRSK